MKNTALKQGELYHDCNFDMLPIIFNYTKHFNGVDKYLSVFVSFILRNVLVGIILIFLAVPSAYPQNTSELFAQVERPQSVGNKFRYQGDVYLVRGFSDIFSRGLDDIGARLNANGIAAKVIHHRAWRAAAVKIYNNQKKYGKVPIVLIGHSLGANAILRIAEFLKKRNVAVQYLVTFEPTIKLKVPSNVKVAVNYFLSNSIMGESLEKEVGSTGSFKNIDMVKVDGVGHFNIEKYNELQQTVIQNIYRYVEPVRASK